MPVNFKIFKGILRYFAACVFFLNQFKPVSYWFRLGRYQLWGFTDSRLEMFKGRRRSVCDPIPTPLFLFLVSNLNSPLMQLQAIPLGPSCRLPEGLPSASSTLGWTNQGTWAAPLSFTQVQAKSSINFTRVNEASRSLLICNLLQKQNGND